MGERHPESSQWLRASPKPYTAEDLKCCDGIIAIWRLKMVLTRKVCALIRRISFTYFKFKLSLNLKLSLLALWDIFETLVWWWKKDSLIRKKTFIDILTGEMMDERTRVRMGVLNNKWVQYHKKNAFKHLSLGWQWLFHHMNTLVLVN